MISIIHMLPSAARLLRAPSQLWQIVVQQGLHRIGLQRIAAAFEGFTLGLLDQPAPKRDVRGRVQVRAVFMQAMLPPVVTTMAKRRCI